nr:hypothetical protein [Tanacetum cinerariifolium]
MLVIQGEGSGTLTDPHHTPSLKAQQSPHPDFSSSLHPTPITEIIPIETPTENPTLRQYSRRATRIAQSKALPTAADEPASLLRDDSQGEAFSIVSGLEAGQDRENIIKTSALPHDSTPSVTSLDSDEGTQDLEISNLKARIKLLEDKDKGSAEYVPPIAEVFTVGVPTGSGLVPTVSAIFTTSSVVTPYSSRPREISAKDKDFVPMASKEEGERVKRKGLKLEQGSVKKMKTSEDVSKEDLKEMMQPVPIEEVYVEALQVKYPIIDREIHIEGKKDYWKIIRLGGHTAVYQFFMDMLKQFDKEDLNQLWTLVKEILSIRQALSDKEKELWVELKRLFEPDFEEQLWIHTQNLMHDLVE